MELCLLGIFNSLSNLSTKEYLTIVGTLKHDMEEEFRCRFDSKYKVFQDPKKKKEWHNQTSFCNGRIAPNRPSYRHIYQDVTFLTCPCTFYDPYVHVLTELENQYHKFGILPIFNSYIYKTDKQGLVNTPNKLIQAFRVIRNFMDERELEKARKDQQEQQDRINKNG